jgi:hypothetical protein
MNSDMLLAQKSGDGAIWYAYRTSDRRIKGIAWYRKAWLQNIQGNPHEAEANYLQALKYLEGTGAYAYESFVYYDLAGNYGSWNDLPNQRKYAQLCLQTARQSGDFDNLALAYQAMASYYHNVYQQRNDATLKNRRQTIIPSAAALSDQPKTHPEFR